MNYIETLDYIHSLNKFGKKAGLENINRLLFLMGEPHKKCKFVHIAGTNGKGSTTTMIASVLEECGYKTGKYISPFVIDFRERMQVNNEMISEQQLIECAEYVKKFAQQMANEGQAPVEFEVVTAIAFEWFARQKCDIVALEVGLGGKFDSTNVIAPPLVAVICSISFDHVNILGDTISKIAAEKCGIIKEGSTTVCYPDQHPDALSVIEMCSINNKNLFVMGDKNSATIHSTSLIGTDITYNNLDIHIPLMGNHQVMNCINAIEALKIIRENGYKISDNDIVNGISKVRFPARMELLNTQPIVILDGAHNESGMQVLTSALKQVSEKKLTLIIGMLADKDFSNALYGLTTLADKVLTVTAPGPRGLDGNELAIKIQNFHENTQSCENLESAFNKAIINMNSDDILVICGSLYLATDMRRIVFEYFKDISI